MAIASAINVNLVWQLSGSDWAVNSLWFDFGGAEAWTQVLSDEVATRIGAEADTAALEGRYSPTVDLQRIETRDFRTDGNPIFSSTVSWTSSGSGDMLPRQTCQVTTLRTALVSRRGRGRIYWPAAAVSSTGTTGVMSAAGAAFFTAFTQGLQTLTPVGTDDLTLSVFSRADNVIRTVTSVSTDVDFDMQTRRRDVSIG